MGAFSKTFSKNLVQQGANLNPSPPIENSILTEDELNYILTEDEISYLIPE